MRRNFRALQRFCQEYKAVDFPIHFPLRWMSIQVLGNTAILHTTIRVANMANNVPPSVLDQVRATSPILPDFFCVAETLQNL